MATILRDAITKEGTHAVSTINSKDSRPYPNGAILTGSDLDNGLLVELDGYDTDGNAKCKPWEGTKQAFVVQTEEADQLLTEYGENDYKNFYNKEGEIVRIYPVHEFMRHETSAFVVKSGSIARGQLVCYNITDKKFEVNGSADGSKTFEVGEVVDIDTDFGYNVGAETIRVQYK